MERHDWTVSGVSHSRERMVAVCSDCEMAKKMLADAFDERWNEHLFPPDQWLSECLPPEEAPEMAWFMSKFPDEGEYHFRIEPKSGS